MSFGDGSNETEVTYTPEQEAYFQRHEQHYRNLNSRLLELSEEGAQSYMKLRNRAARLVRMLEISAPKTIIDSEIRLVARALDEIDTMWRESMPPD